MSKTLRIHHTTAKNALDYLSEKKLLEKDMAAKRNVKYYNYDLIREIQSTN
jgi:hypothetical protein